MGEGGEYLNLQYCETEYNRLFMLIVFLIQKADGTFNKTDKYMYVYIKKI